MGVEPVNAVLDRLPLVALGKIMFIISHQIIFFLGWLMLTSFSSQFLPRLTFVQFGIHSVVSSYTWCN